MREQQMGSSAKQQTKKKKKEEKCLPNTHSLNASLPTLKIIFYDYSRWNISELQVVKISLTFD